LDNIDQIDLAVVLKNCLFSLPIQTLKWS